MLRSSKDPELRLHVGLQLRTVSWFVFQSQPRWMLFAWRWWTRITLRDVATLRLCGGDGCDNAVYEHCKATVKRVGVVPVADVFRQNRQYALQVSLRTSQPPYSVNKKAVLSQRLPRDAPDRRIRQYAHGLLLESPFVPSIVPIAGQYGQN